MKHVQQEDLLRYGLIPEFIGRLPVLVTLEELSKDALVRIITEPKNALVKQYKKLFDMDHVDLEIQPDAIEAIAEKALEKGIKTVVFDRGGFIYQGKIQALADAAREAGLEF